MVSSIPCFFFFLLLYPLLVDDEKSFSVLLLIIIDDSKITKPRSLISSLNFTVNVYTIARCFKLLTLLFYCVVNFCYTLRYNLRRAHIILRLIS
ncbi:hypothetical protein J3F83DRAFT_722570 [Trichoderma novae-zelandiae]